MFKILEILRSFIPNLESLPLPSVSGIGPRWLFGIFGLVVLSLYGLSMGRTRAVLSLMSLYSAFVITKLFPYSDKIETLVAKPTEDYWIPVGLFLTTYIVIFIIFNFSFLKNRVASSEFSLFGVVLVSILQLGFLISIILSILPKDVSVSWSQNLYNYFGTPIALFFWAIAPLPALLFLKQK